MAAWSKFSGKFVQIEWLYPSFRIESEHAGRYGRDTWSSKIRLSRRGKRGLTRGASRTLGKAFMLMDSSFTLAWCSIVLDRTLLRILLTDCPTPTLRPYHLLGRPADRPVVRHVIIDLIYIALGTVCSFVGQIWT
jgi:hypothetical protein